VFLIAFTCIIRAEDSQQQQLIRVNKPHQQQQEQGQERTKVIGNIQREAQNNDNNKNIKNRMSNICEYLKHANIILRIVIMCEYSHANIRYSLFALFANYSQNIRTI